MTTMISNLPSDLVMEILSRIPLNFLREVRLTCKQWNYYSKIQCFRKMHIDKASSTAESQMITVLNNNIYLTSIFVGDGEPSFEHKGKLNEQVKVSEVYHCEGLLLCFLEDDPRLLVWNPYLMEKRWIRPICSHTQKGWEEFTYALGYEDKKDKSVDQKKKDKSSRSCCVKLLRFIDYYYRAPEYQFFWYEMYDFESGLWKTLDITPHWCIDGSCRGISLKGNTYWCASERNIDKDEDDCIICFDFTKERFGQLLPLPFSAGFNDFVTLSCVREEKLAVLVNHCISNTYEVDIWITTKIEAQEVLWSKFLRVESQFGKMVSFISEGFFIDEEKKIAMGFDRGYGKLYNFNIIGDAGYLRQLKIFKEPADYMCRPIVCAYVPSLLQLEQPTGGGQRKQQSELEKCRYDENMSRLVQVEANYHRFLRRFVTAEENVNYDGYWMRLFPAEENQ